MDMTAFKRWCCANIIWPGVALVDNETWNDPPPPSCHLPAGPPSPGGRLLDFMEESWFVVLLLTLAVVISFGIVLGVHHMRWRRLLREQLEHGHIDQEQYDRLR
jgi:hypothetical protein